MRCEDGRGNAEDERPDDAVAQRLLALVPGETEHEHSQHHGVVRAQQSLEDDEENDCEEVGNLEVHGG